MLRVVFCVCVLFASINNKSNNSGYLQCSTRTCRSGYMFFKCTRFQDSVRTTHAHTHTVRAMGLKKTFFEENEDFHDLKELTGGMMELVPGTAGTW